MDTLVKADIFFFVSTISTVVVTVFIVVAIVYAMTILTKVKHLATRAELEADKLFTVFYFIKKIFNKFT